MFRESVFGCQRKRIIFVCLGLLLFCDVEFRQVSAHEEFSDGITKIAFGSCNRHNIKDSVWPAIVKSDPDIFIWTGDIVYADTKSPRKMRRKYKAQKRRPAYRQLLKNAKVIGVWDDHDYGEDDAGKEYPMKEESQQILLDFLDEHKHSMRRKQEGIYTSYLFGPPGKQVNVILLDTRYFRDQPGPQADILGEKQWTWLTNELETSDANLHLIVSSIQFLGDEHAYEFWGRYPQAKQRMLDLLASTRLPGVIFVTGDRHFAEISVSGNGIENFYPFYEITASGLTHSYKNVTNELEPNRFRIAGPYGELNFGVIEIDWEHTPVSISMQIRNQDNNTVLKYNVSLRDLKVR